MDLINSVTAKVKQVLSPDSSTMPPKAKKEEPKTAAAKKVEPKKTPAKKDDKKTPAKKADTKKTSAKKDDKNTPAKKDDKKTPAKKEDEVTKEEPKKEEPKKAEANKIDTKKTPAKKDDKKTPAKKEEDSKEEAAKKEEAKDDKMGVDEKKEDDKKDDKKDTKKKSDTEKEAKKRPATADSDANRSKRARKDPTLLEPEDFTMKEPEGLKIQPGRGAKLGSFPSVKASIENSKHTAEEIGFAHQFLFGKKGKFTKKEMKEHLLAFSGYLKPIPNGKSRKDKEVEKEEEALETKYSKKAFALKKDQIVDLCNFFNITLEPSKDEPKMDKDTCIDRLLDFLGTPHKDWLKESSTKKASAEKKPAAKKATSDTKKASSAAPKAKVVSAPKNDYTKIKSAAGKNKMPSDEVIRAWVRTYVACFNVDKATTKHALATCSDKFGVDMAPKKKQIKEMLAEEL